MLPVYLCICLAIALLLSYEYLALGSIVATPSILDWLSRNTTFFKGADLSLVPGHPISYWEGWIGYGAMAALLFYTLRKRWHALRAFGSMEEWLNFHIFLGLLGPLLIGFHARFGVRGFAGFTFWIMMITMLSGIIGRYFYVQTKKERSGLTSRLCELQRALKRRIEQESGPIEESRFEERLDRILQLAYGNRHKRQRTAGMASSLAAALLGDIRIKLFAGRIAAELDIEDRDMVKEFALTHRRIFFLENFQTIMAYWHSFHLPFAITMYILASIHVIIAIAFGVWS
jgi:hypothetical protein